MRIVFAATPDIALKSFKYFIDKPEYDVLALITQKAKSQNRGKKIVERNITKMAKENNIAVFEPDKISKDIEVIEKLKALKPDFIITFAFGQILSQEVIDIPKFGIINLHASLLPKYRGANPISQAIMDGCSYSGVTTMKTALELDAGDICLQEKIEITPDMNVIELMEKISDISPKLLDETLKGLYNSTLIPTKQNNDEATFTKKIKKEQKQIDWSMSALDLHNKIRAMYKINTNHTTYNSKLIQVLKTKPVEVNDGETGEVTDVAKDGIVVKCLKDSIKIITVKPEGKGEMSAYDWANGARIKKGVFFK